MGPLLASTLYLHILIWAIASLTMLKFFAVIYADISNCSAVSWNFAKQIKFVMKWTFAQKTWFSKEDFDFKTVFTVDLENLAWTEHSESQGNMTIFHSLSLKILKKKEWIWNFSFSSTKFPFQFKERNVYQEGKEVCSSCGKVAKEAASCFPLSPRLPFPLLESQVFILLIPFDVSVLHIT